jgi:SAM-dependent methyltransferase
MSPAGSGAATERARSLLHQIEEGAVGCFDADREFAGSVPQLYEHYLVPLIHEPYVEDLGARVLRQHPSRVLEIAAGTGAATRRLARVLAPDVVIVATDVNQPMLNYATALGTNRPVQWHQADAMQLPYPDEDFDVLVCQFGAMCFEDKARAFAESLRVLRRGGCLIFSVWDRIDENQFAAVITAALDDYLPDDPPRFVARVLYGYSDTAEIAADLAAGGFTQPPEFITLAARSRADSARIPAVAYCQGTSLRHEIERQDPLKVAQATDVAAAAIAKRFGHGAVEGKIQAHVITVQR